jgi:sporulation protein YlmC with PRC-barrel domain
MLSIRELDRLRVLGEPNKKTGARRKVGAVGYVLFHPTELRVVGLAVERSDLALMIERKDRYVALDRVTLVDGEIHTHGKSVWDGAAAKRLGFSWDDTIAWSGMPVLTESGTELGTVRDAVFAEETGALNALGLSEGTTRDVAIGVRDLPARMVRGFDGEAVVVSDEATRLEVDGGAAAAAGKATAVAKVKTEVALDVATEKIDDAAVAAGEAAGKAVAYARVTAKKAAQSESGKKAMGWFKALKDEVVDAMGDPDDE